MKRLCWSGQPGVQIVGKTSANPLKQLLNLHSLFLSVSKTATVFLINLLYPDFSSRFLHKLNVGPAELFDAFPLEAEA